MDWIDLTQDRDQWRALVSTEMKIWVPKNAVNCLSGCTIGGFSKRAQLHKQVFAEVYILFYASSPLICNVHL
jgi:hypothetical protein